MERGCGQGFAHKTEWYMDRGKWRKMVRGKWSDRSSDSDAESWRRI